MTCSVPFLQALWGVASFEIRVVRFASTDAVRRPHRMLQILENLELNWAELSFKGFSRLREAGGMPDMECKIILEWWDYLPIGLFQAAVTVIVWFIASYIKEKGKNLATREDIHQITRQIESAKIEYAKELEGIKSQLNAKFHAHTVRFEKEFDSYKEIWGNLVEMREAFVKYRFQANMTSPDTGDFKRQLSNKFAESITSLVISYDKNRPFFSKSVYETISQITEKPSILNLMTFDAKKRARYDDSSDSQEIIKRVIDDSHEIEQIIEDVCRAIRDQLDISDDASMRNT
jgi:hypothetical protein